MYRPFTVITSLVAIVIGKFLTLFIGANKSYRNSWCIVQGNAPLPITDSYSTSLILVLRSIISLRTKVSTAKNANKTAAE